MEHCEYVLRLESLGIDTARPNGDVILRGNCMEWVWVVYWSSCRWSYVRTGRNWIGRRLNCETWEFSQGGKF